MTVSLLLQRKLPASLRWINALTSHPADNSLNFGGSDMAWDPDLTLFGVGASRGYGARVAQHLDLVLSEHEEREFEDGEHKIRPLVEVRRQDVFVIHSLYGDAEESPNDKLCRLLFFIGALKDAGAERVTAVVPYLCYARKDRRTQPRDPITTKYVARLFEASGADGVITLRCPQSCCF